MAENTRYALAQTTAHLLASTRYAAVGNVLLFASAIWNGGYLSAVQVLLFAVLVYLHLRMDFDRRLFADFASGRLKPENFDECRAVLGLGRAANAAEMPQRCLGALKLLKKSICLTAVQCGILAVQIIYR
ncbi:MULTISPECIES: hypothetical protein [unclassified Neisseria]|uniref:hypothetical protein n=1 Tax=unclassified Neisseria TaxID=2623750 RepID=UPI0026664486|nr:MULTISPECIES: hypothetical protein [unclassified Neisseria]MDO1509461.1 hypothetical protein [Neisseria sp. MVDL19-042950]MDO1515766.1 hypothetical protein [Neisseria sp. MVDL18-041461]MDO1563410.1 hypothetical protein [Neisseria sp. MVDL20-010259]